METNMIGFLKFVGVIFLVLIAIGISANKSSKFDEEDSSNVRIFLYWIDKWLWIAVAVFIALGKM